MVDTDDTQQATDIGRQTTPEVWHKLPTFKLKHVFLFFEKDYLFLQNFIYCFPKYQGKKECKQSK